MLYHVVRNGSNVVVHGLTLIAQRLLLLQSPESRPNLSDRGREGERGRKRKREGREGAREGEGESDSALLLMALINNESFTLLWPRPPLPFSSSVRRSAPLLLSSAAAASSTT